MTFFYNLNKKLSDLDTHQTLNEGVYQGGPDKSQIPAVNRPGNQLTTADLEKERTQSPTSAEGMRALQDKLSKINPMDETMDETMDEAAKWRDPKYKDKLYTQEPRDYDQYDYGDDDYYNPKPADYPGEKNLKGGGEFSHNDPLQKGQGIGRSGIKHSILDRGPRKGLPSRDQITSLKGSIKSASGTHARPNLPEAGLPMVKGPNGKMVPKFAADGKGKNDLQGKKSAQATESIKLVAVKEGADQTAKVYCDTAYNEFHVRVFNQGQEVVKSRYFTQNQADAIAAANYMVEGVFTMAPKKSFADKISGAKQEVDEMLGDVAAEAMKSAIGKMKMTDEGNDFSGERLAAIQAGKPTFKVGGKTYRVTGDTSDERAMGEAEDLNPFTNYKTPRAERPKVGSTERGALHDIEHTATGRRVTRRVDPNTGHSVGADDDTPGEKRGRGRPAGKGAGKSIGAKGPSGKSKLMTREGDQDIEDRGEYDQEGEMAKDDIKTIVRHAQALSKVLDDNDNLPEWVQSKLAKIEGMMISIDEYMQNQAGDDEEPIAEKAVSKKQQKFMGMVHAAQTGKKPASKEVATVAKSMGKKDAEDFASTKHKGLPNKVKEESTDKEDQKAERAGNRVAKDIEHDEGHKGQDDNRAEKAGKRVTKDIEYDDKKDRKEKKKAEVEENTVAGSVAPAMGGKASKGSGGMQFGKGVYEGALAESFNNKLKTVLNEGMTINMSADQDGKKSLTVTATDEDADQLAQILKMSGLGGSSEEACSTCGKSGCGCEQMEEDLANSADNTVYADANYMVNGITDGLNGRKTDQSTLGTVINQDPRRTVGSIAEEIREQQEARLWNLYKQY